ncbi:MAG: hypothetical protein IT456_02040, partial [Planctomycetes bacterium]|nr:hypothetical protein [Planctomycetota bacterium]
MSATNPVLLYFPAIPAPHGMLEPSSLGISQWRIGVPGPNVPWRDDRFRRLSLAFVDTFTPRFGAGCLVWRVQGGFDGAMPSEDDLAALQLAVTFCLLDANDSIDRSDPNGGHYLSTTENGLLVVQPIDVAQGFITQVGGGLLRKVLNGGGRIGEAPIPIAEGAVRILRPALALVSELLGNALFSWLRDPKRSYRRGAAGLRLAMTWHASALQNARSVTVEQRIIALKTGFEALIGSSNSWKCAQGIRQLFEASTRQHAHVLPWKGILWSPNEKADIARRWQKKNGKWTVQHRTDLEDWFMHFAAVRNDIIHEGVVRHLEYRSPRKTSMPHLRRYDGNMFHVAERLLREAIKARLGSHILLARAIEHRQRCDQLAAQLRDLLAARPLAPAPAPAPAATQARTVDELLGLLGVSEVQSVEVRLTQGAWRGLAGLGAPAVPLSEAEAVDLLD